MGLMLVVAAAFAADPTLVHQGRLVGVDGGPVEGAATLRVGLYAAPTGLAPVWTADYTTTLAGGYYTLQLGPDPGLTAALGAATDLWVDVSQTAPIAASFGPRTPVSSVPRAVRADVAAHADVADRVTVGTGLVGGACSPSGALRFDPSGPSLVACDGAHWVIVGAAAAPADLDGSTSVTVNQVHPSTSCTALVFVNAGGTTSASLSSSVTGTYTSSGCTNTCDGTTLDPAETCSVGVRGSATAPGSLSGSVVLSAGSTSHTTTLTGAASGFPIPVTCSGGVDIGSGCRFAAPGTYTFTLPSGVTTVTAKVWGAGGGARQHTDGGHHGGGSGGFTNATLTVGGPVSAGATLTIVVGGKGGNPTAGSNGGGAGGSTGAGGGGRSEVKVGSTVLAIAGGGGGGGSCGASYGGSGGGASAGSGGRENAGAGGTQPSGNGTAAGGAGGGGGGGYFGGSGASSTCGGGGGGTGFAPHGATTEGSNGHSSGLSIAPANASDGDYLSPAGRGGGYNTSYPTGDGLVIIRVQ